MGFVYVLKTGQNQFKIGRTKNVEKRIKELSTGNPNTIIEIDRIETEHDTVVEKFLQNKFYENRCKTGDSTEHYELSLEELKQGLQEARKFLEGYIPAKEKAEEYSKLESNGIMKAASDEVRNLCGDLYSIKGKMENLKFEEEALKNQIKCFIENSSGIDGLATWKSECSTTLDIGLVKEKYPEIFTACSKETQKRSFKLLKTKED